MASITDINAGVAVVEIDANDNALHDALKDCTKSLENFADVCLKVGMRLLAACDLLIAPIARVPIITNYNEPETIPRGDFAFRWQETLRRTLSNGGISMRRLILSIALLATIVLAAQELECTEDGCAIPSAPPRPSTLQGPRRREIARDARHLRHRK